MKITFETDDATEELTSINVASALISHQSKYSGFMNITEFKAETFEIEDLEEIANHLLVYCKCERERRGFKEQKQ